ncbi:recombinase family protein [Gimesia maris]|uniref:recombinase family protein n=1 Tax=Gimesia maris TaxID=122 RepID=UPI0030DD6A96|tara:strand:- start:3993 stop:4454 length:462 start_codon:yes stop_codon:yes gene_type:complete
MKTHFTPNIRPACEQSIHDCGEQVEKVERAIDCIAAEFHEILPLAKASKNGALYARDSVQQTSITKQVRRIYEIAVNKGIYIPREYVFIDQTVTGQQHSRPGLNQLRVALENQSVDILMVFSASRLYRDCSSLMQFIGRNSVQGGIQIISVDT